MTSAEARQLAYRIASGAVEDMAESLDVLERHDLNEPDERRVRRLLRGIATRLGRKG